MTQDEFNIILDSYNLSLKDFAQMSGASYSAVHKWKYSDTIPDWAASWILLFEEKENIKKINNMVDEILLILLETSPKIKNKIKEICKEK